MKGFLFGVLVTLFFMALLFVRLHQVGQHPRHPATAPDETYKNWLRKTADLAATPVDSSAEELWIQRIKDAFTPFEAARAAENFPEAYAEEFYFRDAFHTFTDREEMTAYMVQTAEQSPGVTFRFSPAVRSGYDFFLPWVMILPDRSGGDPQESLGVSHLRFNSDGRVIFHQDYWDSADVLVPRVPVANGLIELVRRRF